MSHKIRMHCGISRWISVRTWVAVLSAQCILKLKWIICKNLYHQVIIKSTIDYSHFNLKYRTSSNLCFIQTRFMCVPSIFFLFNFWIDDESKTMIAWREIECHNQSSRQKHLKKTSKHNLWSAVSQKKNKKEKIYNSNYDEKKM